MTKQLIDIVSPDKTFDYLIEKNQEYFDMLNKLNLEYSSESLWENSNYYNLKNNLNYDYSFLNQCLCKEQIKNYRKLQD